MIRKSPGMGATLLALALTGCSHLPRYGVVSEKPEDSVVGRGENLPPAYTVHPDALTEYAYHAIDIETAPWHRFLPAAVSFTFDDGTMDQYELGFPELEARGQKATFFIITGRVGVGRWRDGEITRRLFSWQQARRLAIAGHEIGSHGTNHNELKNADADVVVKQLRDSQSRIQNEIPGRPCVSFCWPYWRSDSAGRSLSELHYVGARSGGGQIENFLNTNGGIPLSPPHDIQKINSLALLDTHSTEQWRQLGEIGGHAGGWFVLNFHGIDDGSISRQYLGWRPLLIETFRLVLDYVSEQDVWNATFGEVLRYVKERESLKAFLRRKGPRSLELSIQDGLDDRVFDQALSFRFTLPAGWDDVDVRQNGRSVWLRLDGDGTVVFDAVPDGGTVVISKKMRGSQ